MNTALNWALENWIEVCGMITGFIYLWFSVRQSILTWPVGIITSLLYAVVFLKARFYAGTGLQFYYLFISIYGWYSWLHGKGDNSSDKILHISRTGKRMWFGIITINLVLFLIIFHILNHLTDSPIPYWDAFTTSMSIVATWMLARKKIEHWLLWILVDVISIILYLTRGLYPTSLLFIGYTVIAIAGYAEWRKDLKRLECQKIVI